MYKKAILYSCLCVFIGRPILWGADVLDLARDAAPELFADTVVRLVEGGKVAPIATQRDLLTQAFDAAAHAQEPMRWKAVPGLGGDTRAFLRSQAGALRLDRLSLEARVVRTLMTIDRPKARELFERVPHPALAPSACEDPLIADAAAYYETAALVAQAAYSDSEKAAGKHVELLRAVLSAASSPAEFGAFARAMNSVALKPAEARLLAGEFAAKLESAPADYRAFTTGIGELRGEVESLAARSAAAGIAPEALVRSFGQYLKNQMSARRCAEDLGDNALVIGWFNASFRGSTPAIEEKEIKPPNERGPGIVAPGYFDSDDASHLHMALLALRQSAEGPRAVAERATAEWRHGFADLVRDWERWQASGSEIDAFHKKTLILRGLLELAAVAEGRETVIKLGVTYLAAARAQQENPAEWTSVALAFLGAAGSESAKVREAYANSGSAGLALLAQWR